MSEPTQPRSLRELSRERLLDLLSALDGQGLTQQQAAARAGLPAQYLSDIKSGRRPMTELVARRLGEAFRVPHEWLSATEESSAGGSSASAPRLGGAACWLPLFPHPIEGDPHQHPKWDGTGVEISSVAVRLLARATHPYVLRFGNDDVLGRLRKGDFVLISQSILAETEIAVVRHRGKLFLARPQDDGRWQRLANAVILPATSPACGSCLGVIWSSLCET